MIGRRLDRLGEPAVDVLETAAVIGPEFDLALLEPACAAPRETMLDALESAAGANLIRALPDRAAAWAFTHALIREALHDELSGLRRARLHAPRRRGARRAAGCRGRPSSRTTASRRRRWSAPSARPAGRARPATPRSPGSPTRRPPAHYDRALQALERPTRSC